MNNTYDSIVVIGDSWSYGSELPEHMRETARFSTIIAERLGIDKIYNIARESATNFCYKWHWLNWKKTHTALKQSLVIIGVTDFARTIMFDNTLKSVQEFPNMLYNEENYPTIYCDGGFFRLSPIIVGQLNEDVECLDIVDNMGNKAHIAKQYYKYQYSDDIGIINTLMELKLLSSLISTQNNNILPFMWANFVNLDVSNHMLFNTEFRHQNIYNNLNMIFNKNDYDQYIRPNGEHPNMLGHEYIADKIIELVDNELRI